MTTPKFDDADLWKGIILFGLNAATYKMALAKVLLNFAQKGKSKIDWDVLSGAFLKEYIFRVIEEWVVLQPGKRKKKHQAQQGDDNDKFRMVQE